MRPALVMLAVGVLASGGRAMDSWAVLRAGEGSERAVVREVGAQGVLASVGDAAPALLAWDRVARVEGDLAGAALGYAEDADRAWRARVRLERGDAVGAEPLLEALGERYLGKVGPTSAAVADALTRCRVMMGAQASAVGPMLAGLAARGPGEEGWAARAAPPRDELREDDPMDPRWYDPVRRICPMVPPVWLDIAATRGATIESWAFGDARTRAIAALYQLAARGESGERVALPERPDEEGAALIYDMVASRVGESQQRSLARDRLAARLAEPATGWLEAWCRTGLGRSLVREPDRESALRGVAELLRVPACQERESPYLTGVALGEAAAALHALGDATGAARLRDELAARWPGHPALLVPALTRIPAGAAPAARPVESTPETPESTDEPGGP